MALRSKVFRGLVECHWRSVSPVAMCLHATSHSVEQHVSEVSLVRDVDVTSLDRVTAPSAVAAARSAAAPIGFGRWGLGLEGAGRGERREGGRERGSGEGGSVCVCLTCCHVRTSNSRLSVHPAVPLRVQTISFKSEIEFEDRDGVRTADR